MVTSNGWTTRLGELDLVTSAMLMVLAVLGLVVTGIFGEIVDLLETHTWLPMTLTLLVLVGIFMTSETRDPSRIELWEKIVVGISVVTIVDASFVQLMYVDQYLGQYEPWTSVAVLLLLIVSGAILAR